MHLRHQGKKKGDKVGLLKKLIAVEEIGREHRLLKRSTSLVFDFSDHVLEYFAAGAVEAEIVEGQMHAFVVECSGQTAQKVDTVELLLVDCVRRLRWSSSCQLGRVVVFVEHKAMV